MVETTMVARSVREIEGIIEPLLRARASHVALRELDAERDRLVDIRRGAIQELRATGWTWQEIASLLGIHRNRAAHLLDRPKSARG